MAEQLAFCGLRGAKFIAKDELAAGGFNVQADDSFAHSGNRDLDVVPDSHCFPFTPGYNESHVALQKSPAAEVPLSCGG